MSFAEPFWFWAFALFPLLAALFFRNERQRGRVIRKLVAARLQQRLAGSASVAKRRARFGLLLLGAACVLVALAQPRWGETLQERRQKGTEVLMAIDVSRSMLANDVAPSRLGRTKLAAEDLLAQLRGDRAGLIAFAGAADLMTPLTGDFAAVTTDLRALTPRSGDAQGGTNLAAAMQIAEAAFGKGESDSRALVIFSDGEELDADGVAMAEELKGKVRVFTVGVGSAEGTIVAVPGADGRNEYVKGQDGQIVKSRLDEGRLRAIAEASGGFYLPLTGGPAQMRRLVEDGISKMNEHEFDAQLTRRPIERYQWPLSAGIALLAGALFIGERKRRVVAALVILGSSVPMASAKNAGVEAYERKDYEAALQAFSQQLERRPANEALHYDFGTAAFKKGDLDQALSAFSKAITARDPQLRAKAEYNLANTLAQRGLAAKEKPAKLQEWGDALAHYDEALKIDPRNEDATFNRDAVRAMMAELQKEPPPQEQSKDEKKEKDQKKEQDQKEQDQKEKQEGGDAQKQDSKEQKPEKGDGKQGQPQKPEDSGGEPKEDQQGGQGENDSAKKESEGKGSEKPEEKGGPKDPQDQQSKGEQGKQQEGEMPQQPERERSGELKGAQPEPSEESKEQQAQAAEEMQAAAEGRMTAAQAKALLESLESGEQRVRLFQPGGQGKRRGGVVRDW